VSVLIDQIEKTLHEGMYIPDSFKLLFEWIESNDLYVDRDGIRYGLLFSEKEMKASWTDTERIGGTDIGFYACGNRNMEAVYSDRIKGRLVEFAQSGGDGSMVAFWLDDDGKQKIVHLGSGSGSVLCCVLADDPIDFLRLLAIGYDEICWNDEFDKPPNEGVEESGGLFVEPNIRFREWVVETFKTTIPATALEIVKNPSEYGDEDSKDPFCSWLGEPDDDH